MRWPLLRQASLAFSDTDHSGDINEMIPCAIVREVVYVKPFPYVRLHRSP